MTDQHELAGRVAPVAGAARNMGRAIAALAQGGAKVVVQARTSTELCRAEGEPAARARR